MITINVRYRRLKCIVIKTYLSKLSLREYNAQIGEALAGVIAMNKVIKLGMPV